MVTRATVLPAAVTNVVRAWNGPVTPLACPIHWAAAQPSTPVENVAFAAQGEASPAASTYMTLQE